MRRKQCEVTESKQIASILERCRVGRLATIGEEGYPYIVPLNFVYWQGAVYFHCAKKGEKMDNIQRDPKVCFEVDIPLSYVGRECNSHLQPCQVHQLYHSVIIRGKAEVVEEITEKVGALNALMASHEERPDFDEIQPDMAGVKICSVVAVRVESITAKSDLLQKKTAEDKNHVAGYLEKRDLPGDAEAAELLRR
mgnify:CR=1 FL=1